MAVACFFGTHSVFLHISLIQPRAMKASMMNALRRRCFSTCFALPSFDSLVSHHLYVIAARQFVFIRHMVPELYWPASRTALITGPFTKEVRGCTALLSTGHLQGFQTSGVWDLCWPVNRTRGVQARKKAHKKKEKKEKRQKKEKRRHKEYSDEEGPDP